MTETTTIKPLPDDFVSFGAAQYFADAVNEAWSEYQQESDALDSDDARTAFGIGVIAGVMYAHKILGIGESD